MIISDIKKFVFFHIHKTGGTTIDYALRAHYDHWDQLKEKLPQTILDDKTDRRLGDLQRYRIQSNNFNGHLDCMSYDQLLSFDENYKKLVKNYYCFTFVRNPYDRIYSEYRMNVELQFYPYVTFDQCLTLSPLMITYLPPFEYINFIGRTENLNHHFAIVCDKLNLHTELVNLHVRSEMKDWDMDSQDYDQQISQYYNNGFKQFFNSEIIKGYRYLDKYSPESIAIVNDYYKRDFETFGYPMLSPDTYLDSVRKDLDLPPIEYGTLKKFHQKILRLFSYKEKN